MNDYENQRQGFRRGLLAAQPPMTFTAITRDTKAPRGETRIRASVIGAGVL
jgi:hypothetical protein